MLSRIPFPSLLRTAVRPVLAAALVVTFIAAPATAADGNSSPLPGAALTNAVLSIDSARASRQQQEPQSQQEPEGVDLRSAVSRDSEVIKNLVYRADGQAPPGQRQPYELSLLEAVELALVNNLQVQVARYNPRSNFEGISAARGQFDPTLQFSLPGSFSRGTSPTTNQTQGGDVITNQGINGGFTWSENLQWGTGYSISWSNSRSSNNNQLNTFNPSLNSTLRGQISQPLLRGFGDVNKTGIRIAMNSYDQSLEQFRAQVQNVIAQVVQSYWNLQSQARTLSVTEEALRLSEQQLERNQIQVEIGTLAPIETVQAETQVANNELSLIQAQNNLEAAQDNLKELINFDALVDDPFAYDLVATEEPEETVPPIDVDEAVAVALDNDPGLAQQRIGLRTAELRLEQARNGALPDLSVNGSFNLQGRSGNRLIRGGEFGGEVIEVIEGGYTDAVAQLLSGDFNTWTIGATLTLPIYNRSAKASRAQAELGQRQQLTQFEQARQQITYDVRQQVRNVENLVQQVRQATRSRELASRQLDAEERKFEVGTTTNFQVLQFQQEFSSSQLREVNAIINLQTAIAQLELTKGTLLQYFGVQIGDAGTGGNGSQQEAVQLPAATGRNR